MGLKNTEAGYGLVARVLHWLIAVLLLTSVIGGNYAASLAIGVEKTDALWLHKSFGVIILTLVTVRLVWRLINPVPEPVPRNSRPQLMLGSFLNGSMYFLMFAQPLSGMAMAQSYGYPLPLFNLFDLPVLLPVNEGMGVLCGAIHGYLWILLLFAVACHVAAALYHHFVRKDSVLRRMLVDQT